MTRFEFPPAAALLACAALVGAAPTALAQTWDRRAEQIAIVPVPGDPPGTYRIFAAWVVEASGVSLLPLNTSITFTRNGTTVGTQVVNVTAMGAGGGCDFCPPPNTCICADPGPCACGALWITTAHSAPIALVDGDVVKFAVGAASGGVADQNNANNATGRTFVGKPAFWNRRLIGAKLTPSACPGQPDLYDLSLTLATDLASMDGPLMLGTHLTLDVNGGTAFAFDFCADEPWLTTSTSCISGGSCNEELCGTGSCAGANVPLSCQFVSVLGGGAETCACSSGPQEFVIPGIMIAGLDGTSAIVAKLSAIGAVALAEIPVLDGDNAVRVPLVPLVASCAADLNKDGVVDGADLGLLLGAWGPCP
ncbi:MAG: hypothetical protein U0575_11215 [Phycisphaerales bacterium]